jgi:hypothetical protein
MVVLQLQDFEFWPFPFVLEFVFVIIAAILAFIGQSLPRTGAGTELKRADELIVGSLIEGVVI